MYATGGLKKFFRLMAMLLVLASIVGLMPLSAIAEGLKGEEEPADTSRGTEQMTPEVNEDTRAGDTTTQLLSQNFDSMSSISTSYSSTGWYAYNAGSGNNWTLNTSSSYAYSGSKSAQVQYDSSNAANCYLVSAPFTVSSGMTNLAVSLYERVRDSSYAETFDVFFVKASDVTTAAGVASATKYTAIASASYTNTTYAQKSGSVTSSALAGQSVRVVVHCSSAADQWYLYIDDITVTETASAPATTYTLNFNVNGQNVAGLQQTGLLDGASVTLPTPTVDFSTTNEKYFIGWVTQSYPTATAISSINPVYYVNSNSAYYTTPYTVDANAANSNDEITLYALFGNWDGTSTTYIGSNTVTYELADHIEAGATYILVGAESVSGTSAYAVGNAIVANDHYLSAVAVTVNDTANTCTVSSANEASVLWVAASATNSNSTTGYSFYNNAVGKYMGLDSGEYLYPGDTAVAWTYTSTQRLDNQIDSGSYFFLSYGSNVGSSGSAGYTTSKDSTTTDLTVRLYKRVEPQLVPAYTNCTTVLHTTPVAIYTVNYYVNGSLLSSESNVSSASLPTAAQATAGINFADYEEDAFVVWVPQTYAKGTLQNLNGVTYYEAGSSLDAATLAGLADSNNVINLYALFAEEGEGAGAPDYTFNSVTTSQPYDFVIAAKVGDNYYPLPQQSSTSTGGRISSTTPITVQTSGTTVYVAAADAVGYTWTISSPANNAYRLYDGAHYLYNSVSGTNLRWDSGTANYWTKGTAVNGTYRLVSTYATTRVLAYSAGTVQTFGAYATSNISSGSTQYYELEILPIATGSGSAYEDYTYTTTLTALAPMHTLTVNFVYAAGGTASQSVTQQVREGETYTVEVPTITGYTPSPATVTGVMGQQDVTVTVTYTPNQHTIHYSAAYPTTGSYTNDVTAGYGDTLTIPSDVPAFTGYTLVWTWRTGSANGAVYTGTTMPDQDVWAIGVYQPNQHTITFYVEGVQYAQETAVFGSQLPPAGLADPTREGYVFTGWVYNGNNEAYTGSTMPDYDLTATATWRAAATAVRLAINPTYVEIDGTAVATATVTVGNGAVLGTDYFITWAITNGSDCAEFVGTTANLTQVTLRGIAQGVATVQVTVTNGRDNPITATATLAVGRYVTGIAVTHLPDQVAYTTGSTLDTTGMVVQYVYNDGSYGDVLTASQYTVTAPNMNTANEQAAVTVTAVENSSWTDSFQIDVHTASGTTEVWTPVNTIDTSKEYLIGFVAGNTVYLALCYSPTQSGYYYTDSSYVNYGYTGIATMDGVNVVGVSGNATSLDYAQWNFSSSSGGTISSVYGIGNSTDGYNTQYLNTWSSTSYSDLYPTTSTSQATNWRYSYDSATGQAVLYRTISSTNRYAQYYTVGNRNLMAVSSTANSTSYVQLYSKQTVATNHTIVFYAPDGKTVVYTVTVEDGGYITAAQLTAAQNAATAGETGNFNGWDYYGSLGTGMFTNAQIAAYPVNEDCYFVANVGAPRWSVDFYDEDGTTLIGTASVEQGQPLTAADLANIVAPSKLGYEFVGWTDDDGETVYTMQDLEGHTPAANEIYTAVYEAIDYTLTIHFVDGGNVGLTLPQDLTFTYGYGDAYLVNTYAQTIMLDNVPYDAEPQAVQGTMPASDLTVNVTYSIRVVEISLVYNGNTYTQEIAYGGSPSQAAFEAACTLPLHFDAGSSYWSTTAGGASAYTYAGLFGATFTDDATFYLNVGLTPCVATFYTVQSGELDNEGRLTYTMLTQQTVQYGAKPTTEPTVADVVVNGSTYTFVGWIVSYDNATYDTAHVYSFADLPALTADTYYRAVYYNTDQAATTRRYVLVEEPVDGMEYIIVDVGEEMAVTDENVTDNHYLVPVPVTLDYSEGGMEDYYCYVGSNITDEQIFWTFEQDGNNWKIKSSNGKYMTVTSNNDGNYLTALASDSMNARWSYDSDNNKLEIVSPSGLTQKYLTYVGGNNRARNTFDSIGLDDKAVVMPEAPETAAKPAIEGTKANVSGADMREGEATRATVWAETTSISTGTDYLIGIVYNNNVYLILGYYNGSSWYLNNGGDYLGYTALATIDSNGYVTGCSGNATNLDYCKWQFSTTSGGTITSTQSGRYLYSYTNTNYPDLYPNTSSTTWQYQANYNRLYTSSASKYLGYTIVSNNLYTSGTTSASSAATIKLYKQQEVTTGYTYTINYYVNGSLAYTDTGTGENFSIMDFEDVAPSNFSLSGYEQTDFIGWYSGTYAVSDTAPNLDYFYNPNTNYGLSQNTTVNLYAMFAKDNTGSGISELASGHGMYVLQTATGTLMDQRSGYIMILDAANNLALYPNSTTSAGYVLSNNTYTRSSIQHDEFGNDFIDLNESSNYKYEWYFGAATDSNSNPTHLLSPMASAAGISSYYVYYTTSNSNYYMYTSSSNMVTTAFTYGGTYEGYTYYTLLVGGVDTYKSGNYYQLNTSSTTPTTNNKYYVLKWYGYPYVVTDASRFSTTLTTAVVNYNITVQQPSVGGTISASASTAPAGTTITLTATPASGYTFGSWTVTDTTNNTTVTVTNNQFTMPAGNVTVTATFTSGSTPVGNVYYEPTSTIVAGEEYLIGYKVSDSEVYLLMNYNPNPIGSNNRYYSYSSNYYAYGIRAQMSGNNVVGVYNNVYSSATINNAEWIFENAAAGYYKIQSARTADNGAYYLRIYQNNSYTDLYASNSDIDYYGHQWQWDPANNRLSMYYSYSGPYTKYVTYVPTVNGQSNFFNAPSTASSVQLYRKRTGSVSDYRFTLNAGTTAQPAGNIKLYGLAEDTNIPEVSVTPNNQTLYWYDENVVWYDETAEIIQQATLVGAFANIDPETAVVSWSTSDDSIVSIEPNGNNCTVTAEGVGVAVVTYSVTDIFGNVYTAQAQIIVQQAPIGDIPEEDETWYTGGPEYKVYIETDHFEAGEKYIIARDYTTSSTSTSVTIANYNRVTSLTTGKSYVFVYGNSSTLANCTTLKALSENAVLVGSNYYKKAIDVTATSSNTVLNEPDSCDYVYSASSDYSGYYILKAEHESTYPYLYSTLNANTNNEYYYLATVGSAANRYSCWTITANNGRFLLRNYGIYYNEDSSYYVAYDTTNNRFTISSSTTNAYLYAFEKSTTTATFTAPTTLSLTPGQTTSSPCFSVTASGTDLTQRVGAAISSSNENVVTVNADGTLTAHMEGTACVTVGIVANGTPYIKEITVKVFDTRSDPGTTALYALRDASLYGKLNVYYSSNSAVSSFEGMHHIEGTPVILYPGNNDTGNVAFVAVDPILEDAVTWEYSSSTGLKNMSTQTYMTGMRYTTSSSGSTYYNTIRLTDPSVVTYTTSTSTTATPSVSRAITYSGSIGTGSTLKVGALYARYTTYSASTLLGGGSYSGSVLSGDNFRIFKLSTVTYNPGVYDDAISGVDIFSIRDTDSDRQYISQTHAIYNEVDAGENFHLDYELIDMPTGYQIHAEDCEWECREMSMIEVNGEYVPIITGFNEQTGTFIVNPALSALDEWQGYVVVGYVYAFTYPGDENVHEVANYGKIYLSSGDYEMAEEDLPDFPEPGFVGLDKTAASEYGAFINTGIGKVELTNFGIPSSKPVDVVLILDISGSMDDNITGTSTKKIRKAKEAAIEFANTLLEGSDNSLSIVTFSNGANVITGDMTATQASFIREGSLNSAAYLINQIPATGGTNFDAALKSAYQIMYDNYQAYGTAHSRAIVFMTDGAPGFYNNVELNDKLTGTQTGNWTSTEQTLQQQAWDRWCLGSTSSYTSLNLSTYFTSTERNNYSANGTNMYLDAAKMTAGTVLTSSNFTNQTWVNALNALGGVGQAKGLGATVYTVGFDIANSTYINAQGSVGLSGTSAAKCMQNNATSASNYYNADANTDLTDVFVNIARQIRLVAKNAVTTDTISEYFDLNVETGYSYVNSSEQTINGTATGSNVITYGYYELDDNYNVKLVNGEPVFHVVETVTLTGTNDPNNNYEATITSATSDLLSGNIYNSNSKKIVAKWFTYDMNTKQFEWHINEGDKMEDKKMYSLSYSVRLLDEYRVEGSTMYPTNAHAELNYTDVYDYDIELEYPIPELPWSGGHVRYEFYLVNEAGQPINTAGSVVPFSQRVIVYAGTDVKFHPTATTSDTKTFRADEIIDDLGLAYELYDDDASYQVTINDDTYTSGAMTLVSNGATYVTGLPGHAQPYNVSGTENYTNGQCPVSTLVSFPVVFKLAISPDVIIVDYAIGVNVDVIANDLLPGTTSTAPLYAVGAAEPASTVPNAYDIVATANLAAGFVTKGSANGLTVTNEAGYVLGTAAVVSSGSKNVIRFTPTQYMISNPQVVDLYCAVQGSIPSAEGASVTTRQAYMYEKLTIVPANVMYYDDSYFTTTANFNNQGNQGAYLNGTGNANAGCEWVVEGTTPDALQHTSRTNDTGKDDVHGYDAALAEFSEHSFNTSHSVTVPVFTSGVVWPTMSFTFSGTGLEIVTDSKVSTGLMSVVITPVGSNSPVKKLMIDTYYSEVEGDDGLTQIPTCRVDLDNYGTYNVTISAIHNAFYANLHGNYDEASMKSTVTIDAIRVFEPIASSNETVTGYYKLNNQAYPEIVNIQDAVINEVNFNAYNDVALYQLSGSTLTAAGEITSGASYAIFNTTANKVLGVDASGNLTSYTATVSGTTLTVEGANSSNLYLWTISESGIELEDEEDEIVRYTVVSNANGKYLTVANANSAAVEYGELTLVNNVSTSEPEFGNMWTYDADSDRLMTGPMKQLLHGDYYRDLYYAIGYFTNFRAVSTVEPGSTETNDALNGLLMLDGGTTNDPEIYKTVGPNNEVYVMPGSTLTFKLTAAAEPAGVYLEMKSPYGTEIKASAYTANTVKPDAEVIRTATGMYYNITDRLVWHKGNAANGEDPRLWYSAAFLVFNETTSIDIQHVLSLSNIKFTYETATASSDPFAANMSPTEYQRVINTVERDKWAVYSPMFDLDVHTAKVSSTSSNGTGISRFSEAYVTVVTSTDVGGLLVKDASGKLVAVKKCTYTDLDGVRTWKLTIDRMTTKSYNVYVTTVSSVFDMKNPVSFKVKVPAITVIELPLPGIGRGSVA